ncbi:MAG: LLM class flavin-dependent oxidoreductase [SAR202 cluster bacterium]|nr:LLM class flavin-dependent oxidoreductase [SAR202 cluster bacterium]MQG40309.1 LLM class flavin-dependent oxidoreductase [SAR202 cluster bacterium]MQG72200.1 LLM class flavin-dependent oxidoreductase [SAR202 cluster bacterium]
MNVDIAGNPREDVQRLERRTLMHCGVMVTGYNQGDWGRLMKEEYDRPPEVSDAENMDNTLYMGDLVEPLGFDSIWATEHYGSAYSMQPNPLQYLAFWAGRTNRVDMGTAVIVAPWWNPVRLAHEISMLDILLRGRRLHLGIGRGIAPHEYASLGYPLEQSHKYFYDVINAIKAADGAERFEFHGEVYDIPPTTIRPQARHKGDLTKDIKVAFTTKASAQMAAENGLGQMFVSGADLNEMTTQVQMFNTIRSELGLPPDQPTTLLWMYCAETEEEAEEGWEYFYDQLTAAQHHYFEWNNPGFDGIHGYEEYLERQTADIGTADAGFAARRGTMPIGTPDQIIEKIKRLQETISLEKIVVHVFYGGMPRDKAEKSLRLFAERVLPAVQAMPTPINPMSLGDLVR